MTKTPEESSSLGSLLAGVVIGAVIGATASLLYAPKSGKETREDLLERLDSLKTRIDETAHTLADATRVKMAETKADLAQAVDAGRAAAKTRAEELRRQVGLD